MVNRIIGGKAVISRTYEAILDQCCDVEGLAAEYASLYAELDFTDRESFRAWG